MATAEVGDDVWREDPTVKALERTVAERFGKAAALLVPSGTMANQIALMVYCRPGDEVLLAPGSHCIAYEGGAAAALAGVQPREIGDAQMLFGGADLRRALRPANIHYPPTRLVWLENSHNRAGGAVFDLDAIDEICAVARSAELTVHLDGARILNAAIALDRPVDALVEHVDSTSLCLSKGLGAPVGSVLIGSAAFIESARRYRKMLGGAMRQSGILAAAGLYALAHNVERLRDDHAHARLLAAAIDRAEGLTLRNPQGRTNIVLFDVVEGDAADFVERCAGAGLLISAVGDQTLRAVTHLDVDRDACLRAAETLCRVAGQHLARSVSSP